MAIFITGDTHGDFRRFKKEVFYEQAELTKDDCIICCGDFGGIWDGGAEERHWLDWLETKPFTILFVSGNHENFDLLAEYPTEEWHGGRVQRIRPSVIHQLADITALAALEGGTLTLRIGDGSMDIPLDGLIPAE